MTLAGVVLSAWLLPAFTRQWDDRQKARQLKAAIVADMASDSARALIGAGRSKPSDGVAESWLRASAQIEAQLRAYFSADVVAAWQVYSYVVDYLVNAPAVQADMTLFRARGVLGLASVDGGPPDGRTGRAHVSTGVSTSAFTAYKMIDAYERWQPLGKTRFHPSKEWWGQKIEDEMKQGAEPGTVTAVADFKTNPPTLYAIQETTLVLLEAVAVEALDAHPVGYSTTPGDLTHDLLPF